MKYPLVSLIITTYNRPKEFYSALNSAINQDYPNLEIIVIDDYSASSISDSILKIIDTIKQIHQEVTLVRNERNLGLSASRNRGVKLSKGEFICFLDDDDILLNTSITTRVNKLLEITDPYETIVHSNWQIIKLPNNAHFTQNKPLVSGKIRNFILSNWLVTHSGTIIFSRKIFDKIGGFDEDLYSSVDHDLWMNFAKYNLCAETINSSLAFSFHFLKRKSIVNDVRTRILGIEYFLDKWAPSIYCWIGSKKGKKYINNYRNKVLIDLLANKIFQFDLTNSKVIFIHLLNKNKFSYTIFILIFIKIIFKLFRNLLPDKVVIFFRYHQKNLQ